MGAQQTPRTNTDENNKRKSSEKKKKKRRPTAPPHAHWNLRHRGFSGFATQSRAREAAPPGLWDGGFWRLSYFGEFFFYSIL
jgi:hypothetical protein